LGWNALAFVLFCFCLIFGFVFVLTKGFLVAGVGLVGIDRIVCIALVS